MHVITIAPRVSINTYAHAVLSVEFYNIMRRLLLHLASARLLSPARKKTQGRDDLSSVLVLVFFLDIVSELHVSFKRIV